MHVYGRIAVVNKIEEASVVLMVVLVLMVALSFMVVGVIYYIGTNMGPPRWDSHVDQWFAERKLDNEDFRMRLCRMERLSDGEVLFCATSDCVSAKCLIVQSPAVDTRMKIEVLRRSKAAERDELMSAIRSEELKRAFRRMQKGDDGELNEEMLKLLRDLVCGILVIWGIFGV